MTSNKVFMTSAVTLLWFILQPLVLLAQQKESALASVDYEFVHVNDTNNRDKPNKTNMRLYLGRQSSQYINQTIAERRERTEALLREQGIGGVVSGVRMSIRQGGGGSGSGLEEIFLYPTLKKLLTIDGISSTTYSIEQVYPELKWEIGQETKEIGGFTVQQARTFFAGRYYTAWFTPEIPFPLGPWKLHGLPGLILEAADDTGEVQFLYKDFVQLEEGDRSIELPENVVTATPRQFDRAKAAYENNPNAANQSSIPAAGANQISQVLITIDANGNRQTLTGDEAKAELERRQLQEKNSNNNPIEKEAVKNN